jgi:hypothetical protein
MVSMVKAIRLFTRLMIFTAITMTASVVSANPLLQLDIAGGFYDRANETTIASTNSFILYAYLTPEDGSSKKTIQTLLNKTYYISAAVMPQYGPLAGDLGSFTFDNLSDKDSPVTVKATQDMAFGVPPYEIFIETDTGDLSSHEIYSTYFKEFSFTFTDRMKSSLINAQDNPDAVPNGGSGMYYVPFSINTSGLAHGYAIHFDLYSEKLGKNGDIDIDVFAPFSHDAQGPAAMPEPATFVLLGSGLIIGAVWKIYKKSKQGHKP